MSVDGVVRLKRHAYQILCGPNGTGIQHRTIKVLNARLRSINDFAPFVEVPTQIHHDRQQPIFVGRFRPLGQFDVLAEDACSGHPDDVVRIEEERLGEFTQSEGESQCQVWIVDGFQ